MGIRSQNHIACMLYSISFLLIFLILFFLKKLLPINRTPIYKATLKLFCFCKWIFNVWHLWSAGVHSTSEAWSIVKVWTFTVLNTILGTRFNARTINATYILHFCSIAPVTITAIKSGKGAWWWWDLLRNECNLYINVKWYSKNKTLLISLISSDLEMMKTRYQPLTLLKYR